MTTAAICAVCDEPVTSDEASDHFDTHGLLLPSEWKFRTWPDGVQVLIESESP